VAQAGSKHCGGALGGWRRRCFALGFINPWSLESTCGPLAEFGMGHLGLVVRPEKGRPNGYPQLALPAFRDGLSMYVKIRGRYLPRRPAGTVPGSMTAIRFWSVDDFFPRYRSRGGTATP